MSRLHTLDQFEQDIFGKIRRKFESQQSQSDLASLIDDPYGWSERVSSTIDLLVPRLPQLAASVKSTVEHRVNSASNLLEILDQAPSSISSTKDLNWLRELREAGEHAATFTSNIESQQVSRELQNQIPLDPALQGISIKTNSGSTYPDFYLADADYTSLETRTRGGKKETGPCLAGKLGNPSNVPDGLELKTNQKDRVPGNGIGVTTIKALIVELQRNHVGGLRVTSVAFGRFLSEALPGIEKIQSGTYNGNGYGETERSTRYIFPPLPACRAAFSRYMGQEVPWSNELNYWVPGPSLDAI